MIKNDVTKSRGMSNLHSEANISNCEQNSIKFYAEDLFEKSSLKSKSNKLSEKSQEKIDKLSRGIPTQEALYKAFNENSCMNYPYQFSFYSYFYPSEVDESLIPLQTNLTIQEANNSASTKLNSVESYFNNHYDRRLKMVEIKCNVLIKVGSIEPKLIRSLPRRKITFFASKPEKISTALTCLESVMPEIFENALFKETLKCQTTKWPNDKGLLVTTNRRWKKHSKKSLNAPLWKVENYPKRVFPFQKSLKQKIPKKSTEKLVEVEELYSNNTTVYYESQSDFKVSEKTESVKTEVTELSKDKSESNVSSSKEVNVELSGNDISFNNSALYHSKYLKFPYNEESKDLFQCNTSGEPINNKLLDYLKISKCKIDSIKCRLSSKQNPPFFYVKTRYESADQLVKLFLLLRYKVKY